jgi:glucoamylase
MDTIVRLYESDPTNAQYISIIDAYGKLAYTIQHTSNPSGDFTSGGLGEPKFMVDGSAFTGNWGRPQRDGPALRALTLMRYVRSYNSSNPELWTSSPDYLADLYSADLPANSVIKADLEYVSHNWQNAGFDLWEEVNGMHFFTAMVQMRAMREGAELAGAFSDIGAADWYQQQYEALAEYMHEFWDSGKGHLVASLDSSRSGLDCAVLLGSLHGNTAPSDSSVTEAANEIYAPWSDEVLITLNHFVADQKTRWPVNAASADLTQGVAIGRYPEDVYDGDGTSVGNPWFLCTSSVSEILYRSILQFTTERTLKISNLALPFWQSINAGITHAQSFDMEHDLEFNATMAGLKAVADGFLGVVMRHADLQGSLSEQFDHTTGFERGAHDLTWSYGQFLEALGARDLVEARV